MIIAVAVMIDGVIRALPAPARHHDVLHKYPMGDHEHGEQGFIDDQEGFVSRERAAELALLDGQLDQLDWLLMLFSEDLW